MITDTEISSIASKVVDIQRNNKSFGQKFFGGIFTGIVDFAAYFVITFIVMAVLALTLSLFTATLSPLSRFQNSKKFCKTIGNHWKKASWIYGTIIGFISMGIVANLLLMINPEPNNIGLIIIILSFIITCKFIVFAHQSYYETLLKAIECYTWEHPEKLSVPDVELADFGFIDGVQEFFNYLNYKKTGIIPKQYEQKWEAYFKEHNNFIKKYPRYIQKVIDHIHSIKEKESVKVDGYYLIDDNNFYCYEDSSNAITYLILSQVDKRNMHNTFNLDKNKFKVYASMTPTEQAIVRTSKNPDQLLLDYCTGLNINIFSAEMCVN